VRYVAFAVNDSKNALFRRRRFATASCIMRSAALEVDHIVPRDRSWYDDDDG
jgi:hypothetical protein